MKSLSLCSLAFALIGMLAAGSTLACSCAVSEDTLDDQVSAAFKHAQSVVVVEVVEVDRRRISWMGESSAGQNASASVARSFKGTIRVGERISIETAMQRAMCGVPVKVGDILLLYAASDSLIKLSLCSRSGKLLKRLDDLQVLYRLSQSEETRDN